MTSDMAVAFESVTKIPAHFWLNIQRGYDEYVARQKREEQLALAYEWACSFPLAKMMELGWIPMVKTVEEKVKALLSFFQVSTERHGKTTYLNQQLKVAFRISLNNTKEPHAYPHGCVREKCRQQKRKSASFPRRHCVKLSLP